MSNKSNYREQFFTYFSEEGGNGRDRKWVEKITKKEGQHMCLLN